MQTANETAATRLVGTNEIIHGDQDSFKAHSFFVSCCHGAATWTHNKDLMIILFHHYILICNILAEKCSLQWCDRHEAQGKGGKYEKILKGRTLFWLRTCDQGLDGVFVFLLLGRKWAVIQISLRTKEETAQCMVYSLIKYVHVGVNSSTLRNLQTPIQTHLFVHTHTCVSADLISCVLVCSYVFPVPSGACPGRSIERWVSVSVSGQMHPPSSLLALAARP